ncbi:universal stress protein [Sabulibacter ruber]|uniref:universal stress protein n=1 Tax=Sabulibacter ruber TaxID=2811901 RepID=UPI001A976FEA|nr:universal stress protein [Sabulibacter ruber]
MQTILCPTNFSKSSENAIRYADEIAQRINSQIILFHNITKPVEAAVVVTGNEAIDTLEDEGKLEKKQLAKLKHIKASLESTEWGIPVAYKTRIGFGETNQSISTLAEKERADLVVMGTTATQGLKEIVTKSLSGRVVQQVSCPVLMVPNNAPFRPIRRMVLATDLRGFCLSDMTLILKLASYFGAQLQLLHVLPKEDETARQFAMEEMQRLSKRIPYQRITHHVAVNACITEGINQFCQSHNTDMLVMGAHSADAWERLFQPELEHTYRTNLPLLLVHPKRIQF